MINIILSIIAFFSGVLMSLSILLDTISKTIGEQINDDIHHNSKKEKNKR